MKPGSVLKSIDWNQLASNNPLEDSLAIAKLCDNRSIRFTHYFKHLLPNCIQSKVIYLGYLMVMEALHVQESWPSAYYLT